jgi:TolB protein
MKIKYLFCITTLLISIESSGQVKTKNITKLTNIESSYPYWSPDGSKIVFQSNRLDDNSEVYIMDSDGRHIVRLTNSEGFDEAPIWSPDGNSILFTTDRDGDHEIYIMDVNGENQRNLTNHPAYDGHPNFSPDGQKIIFNSSRIMSPNHSVDSSFTRTSNIELYEMNLDGSNVTRVTNYPSWDTYPDISPDGTKIAFRRRTVSNIMGKDIGNSEVFIANRDGSEAYNITNHPEHDGWPSWSPDGTKIAFASERERGQNWQIYTIKLDGTELTRLTEFDSQGAEFAKPQWSPKGDKILCTRTKDGNVEIYLIELE